MDLYLCLTPITVTISTLYTPYRSCPDCGKESQFGFGAVVMPFKSFVCDLCKSAHQSYSHRVKSVTMSNWNMDEVKVLAAENGGGNLRVLDTWHGGMSAAECGRPSPQSDLNAIKRFVQRVYIDKAFYRDAPLRTTSKPKHSAPKAQKSPQQKKKAPTSPVLPSAVLAPGGTTASDLLSFEAFPPPAPAARTADFVADFGDFAAPPSGVPAAANLSNLSSSSSSSSSFAFMNSSSSGSTNGNTQNNGSDCSQFGDFSNFASSSQQISTAMNGGGGPASTTSFDSLTSSTVGSSTNSSMSGSPGVFDPFATTSAPPVLTASQSVPVTTNYSAAAMGRHGGLMPQPMSTGNLMQQQQQQQQMQQQRQQQMQQQMQHHPAMTAQAPGMIQRSFSAPSASQASAMANNSSAAISMMMGPGGGGQRGPYLTPQQQAWLSQQQQQAGTAASNDPFAGLGSMKQRI
jgi:hypothetical protein